MKKEIVKSIKLYFEPIILIYKKLKSHDCSRRKSKTGS